MPKTTTPAVHDDPYRHPAGRTCAGATTTIAVVVAMLAALARKATR